VAAAPQEASDAKRKLGIVLWENHRKTIGKWWFYPLVNVNKKTGKIQHFIAGKTHELSMGMFNSFLYVYQRVMDLPEIYIILYLYLHC